MTPGPVLKAPRLGQDVIESSKQDHSAAQSLQNFLDDSTLMKEMREALGAPEIPEPPEKPDPSKPFMPFGGQPWVTPIIGSGPLGVPAGFLEKCQHLPQAIVIEVKKAFTFEEGVGADPELWLADFAATLIRQRVRGADVSSRSGPGHTDEEAEKLAREVGKHAALLVLVAAHMTRTFHRMSLDTCRPISRWGSEKVEMRTKHDRWVDLDDEYLSLLRRAIATAREELSDYLREQSALASEQEGAVEGGHKDTMFNPILGLLVAVETQLSHGHATIRLVQLEQVIEAAWLVLLESIAGKSYPGWTNLLLRLVLRDNASMDNAGMGVGHVRPRWRKMEALQKSVGDMVRSVAQTSWTGDRDAPSQGVSRAFYDAVATTLWAEQDVREWVRRIGPKEHLADVPARPTAYVSSFDMELEMALWRTADPKKHNTYSVIFPAYAVAKGSSHLGEFVWVEAVIHIHPAATGVNGRRTDDDFKAMTTVEECNLLTAQTPAANLRHHPLIVRIVGCPLLTLPNLSADADNNTSSRKFSVLRDNLDRAGIKGTDKFIHAITVDEYLALRQTGRDWVWSLKGARGLPSEYFEGGNQGPRRYWTIFGVPFRDPAIRLRVLSILAGPKPAPEQDQSRQDQANQDQANQGRGHETASSSISAPPPDVSVPEQPTRDDGKYFGLGLKPSLMNRTRPTGPAGGDGDKMRRSESGTDTHASGVDVQSEVDKQAVAEEPQEEPRRHGLVVNTRADDEEVMLLSSLGFTVVQATSESVGPHLTAYAAELRAAIKDLPTPDGDEPR